MSLDGVDMVSSIAMPLDEVVFLVVDPLFLDGVILALASRWAFSLDGVILALASCWAFSLDGVILASGKQTLNWVLLALTFGWAFSLNGVVLLVGGR